MRISQYGLSINRYFVTLFITLIIGFSAGAICFPKIRLRLFITLFAGLAVLSLYGPLSARNIAFWSQKSRIVHLLSQRNITLPLEKNALSGIGGALANDLSETITDFVATFPYEKWNMALFGGKYSKKELTSSWAYGYDVRGYLGIQKGYGEREEKESKDTQF